MYINTDPKGPYNFWCIRTSASIRFEAASISFALPQNFTRSRSKVDQFDSHMLVGLKWIQVDSMSVVGGVRIFCMLRKLCI